jgi:hypothetical protein
MKVVIRNLIICVGAVAVAAASTEHHIRRTNQVYQQAYADATQCFKQWLLDVDFAEYDRKTGEWKLAEADTIQGNLIKPWDRKSYVNIEDHIDALEHELVVLKKQQEALNKRKPTAATIKPDLAKSPL